MTVRSLNNWSGQILHDRYQILSELGKQAGRITLLALDMQHRQQVAIKLLLFGADVDWNDLKLFERETQTLQTLSHPAIPSYLDSFELDLPQGKGFALVQSYIEAKSLEEHLKAGRSFSEGEIRQILTALLHILCYLHRRQPPAIHRDIKPSNILLADADENSSPHRLGGLYLVDFGSVQTLASKQGQTITVVGTYGYMPPEQFGGRAVPASDIYGLGATAIALATGLSPADLPQDRMKLDFRRFTRLSPDLTQWIEKAIEPSLDKRFSSARIALDALEKPASIAKKPVTTLGLLWHVGWRSLAMGTGAGAVYGGIYGAINGLFMGIVETSTQSVGIVLIAIAVGAGSGAGVGLWVGAANALLVGLLTRLFFFPLKNVRRYRRVLSFLTPAVGTLAGMFGFFFPFFISLMGSMTDTQIYAIVLTFNIIPSIVLGLSMGAISKLFARWYERRSRGES
ncbi:MAG: serine/threonine-protein kinase [Cyanobacteriota bacterium]|nr:serine/threonine-protein kinase [Cyanobacteriota bacterium]